MIVVRATTFIMGCAMAMFIKPTCVEGLKLSSSFSSAALAIIRQPMAKANESTSRSSVQTRDVGEKPRVRRDAWYYQISLSRRAKFGEYAPFSPTFDKVSYMLFKKGWQGSKMQLDLNNPEPRPTATPTVSTDYDSKVNMWPEVHRRWDVTFYSQADNDDARLEDSRDLMDGLAAILPAIPKVGKRVSVSIGAYKSSSSWSLFLDGNSRSSEGGMVFPIGGVPHVTIKLEGSRSGASFSEEGVYDISPAGAFVHECYHVWHQLEGPSTKYTDLFVELRDIYKSLKKLYEEVLKKDPKLEKPYGLVNFNEFVAEAGTHFSYGYSTLTPWLMVLGAKVHGTKMTIEFINSVSDWKCELETAMTKAFLDNQPHGISAFSDISKMQVEKKERRRKYIDEIKMTIINLSHFLNLSGSEKYIYKL